MDEPEPLGKPFQTMYTSSKRIVTDSYTVLCIEINNKLVNLRNQNAILAYSCEACIGIAYGAYYNDANGPRR